MFKTDALNSSTSGAYVDKNDLTSTPGTRLEANDRNIIQDELVALVESSGETINTSGDFTTQVDVAVAGYASGGANWYEDTGSADDYELDRITSASEFTLPGRYFDGMEIKFEAATTNTGASVVEVGSLGTKSLVDANKAALAASDITSGDLIEAWYDSGTSSGVFVTPSINSSVASLVAQIVQTQTGAVATGETLMIRDNSIPQNTEGDEYITLAITPKSATNRLLIMIDWQGTSSVNSNNMIAALFQDSIANALAVGGETTIVSAANISQISFTHDMVAGTTSATTFKLRVGGNLAATLTMNGVAAGQLFGGVYASGIKIIEYTP